MDNHMATCSTLPIAYRLLRGYVMCQHVTQSAGFAPPKVYHVAGIMNILANVASHLIKGIAAHFPQMEKFPHTMRPQTFLIIFNARYPLPPQKQPWGSLSSRVPVYGPM
jgi:hypothetical protein